MTKFIQIRVQHYLLLCLMFASGCSLAQECQLDNAYLEAMPESHVSVVNNKDEKVDFVVKTALNNQTRAAGFQRVCASTIAETPILFVFDRPVKPSFHMRNVVAPIDIAFIDAEGRVESIQSMLPYVVGSNLRPLYSPKREVVAALEAKPGFYTENNIEIGSVINWNLIEQRAIK